MSKQNCALYVDKNGRYCCREKVFTIGKGKACGMTVVLGNTGPVDLLVYPTGDTNEVAIVHSTLEEGSTTVLDAGTYKLGLPCDELDGKEAPKAVAEQMSACCHEIAKEGADAAFICACLEAALGGTLTVEVTGLIEKLCAGDPSVSIAEIMAEILLCIQQQKKSDTEFQVAVLACFEILKTNTAAITGIETAFGQLGCIFVDGVQTGSVLVCKVSPEDGSEPVTQVHAYYTDGTVDTNYTGAWEPCTNLTELLECLKLIKAKPDGVHLKCFKQVTEKKVGYQVNDFDPGDIKIGALTSVDFTIEVPDGCTVGEVTVDGAPAGATVVAGAPGQYKLEWIYDGNDTPNWPVSAVLSDATGATGVLTGDDFFIASGGGESALVEMVGKVYLKELCFAGKPNVYQDAAGEVVDVSELEPCPDTLDLLLESIKNIEAKLCVDPGECITEPLAGNWCDISLAVEPDQDDVINANNVLIFVETCGAKQTLNYFIAGEGGALEPYEVIGEVVDCDTYEPPAPEPPECPDGAVFEQVCIPANSYGILDNSTWRDAPGNHLQNGSAYEITLTHEDGSTTVLPVLADPYFTGFIKAMAEALPGCKVLPVCANHSSPKGCHPKHVANLAAYPAYDAPTYPADVQNTLTNPNRDELWATGWLIDCAGCESPIVRAEITASSNAAWVGANKDIKTYQGEKQVLNRAITCYGTFWKDCDDNDIPAPAAGCCAAPCNPGADALLSLIESMKIEKPGGIPGADYQSAFQYINGRPPASSAWALVDLLDPANPVTIASGPNLNAFTDDLESKGYNEWSNIEQHYVCPCPPGAAEAPGRYVVTIDGEVSVKVQCIPLSEAPGAPAKVLVESLCALRVEECNSAGILAELKKDFESCKVYLLSELTGDLRSREWVIGPRTPGFIDTEQGSAIRESWAFPSNTTVDGPWVNLAVNDTDNASDIQDIQIVEGFMKVESGFHMRYEGASAGYIAFELGECCGDLELLMEGSRGDSTANPTSSFYIPKGIHAVRIWNIDDFSNTSRTVEYSVDGGQTFVNGNTPPGVTYSRIKPEETERKVKVLKTDGSMVDFITDEVLDKSLYSGCPQMCKASNCLTC